MKYTVDEVLLTYSSWSAMKKRCSGKSKNKNDLAYSNAGITVCPRWQQSFHDFIADVGPRPTSLHTLDRFPNMSGNYEPGNVRWADKAEQALNRRSTKFISFNGETLSITAWAKRTGIRNGVIGRRLAKSWTPEQILTTPVASFEISHKSFISGKPQGKKLSLDQVQSLVEKAKSGNYVVRELAQEFNITKDGVYKVLYSFGIKRLGRKKKADSPSSGTERL